MKKALSIEERRKRLTRELAGLGDRCLRETGHVFEFGGFTSIRQGTRCDDTVYIDASFCCSKCGLKVTSHLEVPISRHRFLGNTLEEFGERMLREVQERAKGSPEYPHPFEHPWLHELYLASTTPSFTDSQMKASLKKSRDRAKGQRRKEMEERHRREREGLR